MHEHLQPSWTRADDLFLVAYLYDLGISEQSKGTCQLVLSCSHCPDESNLRGRWRRPAHCATTSAVVGVMERPLFIEQEQIL